MGESPFLFVKNAGNKAKMNLKSKQKFIKTTLITQLFLLVGLFVLLTSPARASTTNDNLALNIISQVNQERAERGLKQLKENQKLNQAATLKIGDMAGNNYFAHTSPAGIDPWYWLEKIDYQYKYAGENLAMDFSSASSAHRAWMKSKTHRDNILSENYEEIGVAVIDGVIEGKDRKLAVQFFGTPLVKKENKISQVIEEITGLSQKGIQIKNAKVQPWREKNSDEMLVYAQVEGSPQKVEVQIGDQVFNLDELREEEYLGLISLGEVNLKDYSIMIKAGSENDQKVFYQIAQSEYAGLLREDKGTDKHQLITTIASVKTGGNLVKEKIINNQNIFLAGLALVCLIIMFNVWILEEEDERLIAALHRLQ
jgi:uncharacterized protein YkwD